MKTLDKYIAKNFLIGYVIAFAVLMGLRIIIDLFVNLDEFTEHADIGAIKAIINISTFYLLNSTLYFRDFAGIITVLAAVFSIGKMVHANEFVAMMASGVSLRRVIAPIVLLSVVMTAILVIDQEFIIPPLSDELVRNHDELPGQETYNVKFITDSRGSLIFAQGFDRKTETLHKLTIITRQRIDDTMIWQPTGKVSAENAVYNQNTRQWQLQKGRFFKIDSIEEPLPLETYKTDLKPRDIPVRLRAECKTLLSWAQLNELQKHRTKIKDLAQLYSQKNFRITEPIINLVMLMICLPVLVCRDPKAMKSAVMISFLITAACLITTFISKMFAAEAIFNRVEMWAWLPIFIFLPIAFIELDSIKT